MRQTAANFFRDLEGIAAIEFALLVPAFLMLLVGTISMSSMFFSATSLHFATEAAARCASVKSNICTNTATTQAFAAANYHGGNGAPVFACTGRLCGGSAACGNRVTGALTIDINLGITKIPTTLRADACYP